ncbi:hypothetical protein [Gordonia soli]|uniref:Replicative helicase inhibitor G39P N-terminal domain-containing protein n=1 Tax=Gordonia soli NBRC 108243 TaxID=1223545 RepID=M0QS47_9ACTN|nr:hypothetical protein [Gordonia soli]GAC70817.1 hypothetical protein GS4_41_00660 [Gordonia soli NBRC 108243]
MSDVTSDQVANAGRVLKHTAFVHRRTAIRPASDTEAKQIAIVWARMFARYKLELPELLEAVERRAIKFSDAPEPGEIVQWAREVRQEWASRAQAQPEQRAIHEAKIDRKIADYAGGFGLKLDGPMRPETTS